MKEKTNGQLKTRIKKFNKRVKKQILGDHVLLDVTHRHSVEPVYWDQRLDGDYTPITEGTKWGDRWESAWFHLKGTVPTEWKGEKVVVELDFNGEALLFDAEGVILQGLTNGSIFDRVFSRSTAIISESCEGGESIELWAEAAANGLFGISLDQDPDKDAPDRHGRFTGTVNCARLCIMNEAVRNFGLDFSILNNFLGFLPEDSVRFARILRALAKAVDVYAEDAANVAAAHKELEVEMSKHANASALTCKAVGHAHIDTGWLWPVRESIRKCARTYSSQLDLIERYPGYVFGASQPQHYLFVKKHYPELYERMKKAIADGTWECQGGMWVEADCNVTSGESLVRQFLHGKHYFMDEFGVDVKNLWIPDVFGYSAALPQIMKKSGCDYFVTQKLSWNQYNKMPNTTFKWRGIDGSEIITHFPPENTYNAALSPQQLADGEKNLQEKDVMDGYLSLFGVGDGGGGPSETHVEHGVRLGNMEGLPKVKFGHAQAFLDTLGDIADELPTWVGELYFELHRGTLTTQARTKRGNRLLENRLRQVEYLYSCLPVEHYPIETLDTMWKTLLINQFHDILPGSSITMVYETTEKEYAEALATCDALIADAATFLTADSQAKTLVNCLSMPYSGTIQLPSNWDGGVIDANGSIIPTQSEGDTVLASVAIPAGGSVTLKPDTTGKVAACKAINTMVLENDLIRYEFDGNGCMVSAIDKDSGREFIEAGETGNLMTLYEDRPNAWDAWDVDLFYEGQPLDTATAVEAPTVVAGPVRTAMTLKLTIGNSELRQTVSLRPGSRRLDFETEVDWNQRHQMLRVAFPTTVANGTATYDIQYGYAERPNHRNTSWDMAKFEVVAHKYADLSTQDYGVALLNDCKYGHKVLNNVIDLNLLRSPTYPDADADQGLQVFTYSLLPHAGRMVESDVQPEAHALNMPPILLDSAAAPVAPCTLTSDGVSMEVLKRAEKCDSLVIRLVEIKGRESTCTLSTNAAISTAVECDLMEWHDAEELDCSDAIELTLKPFEIRTFKLK